MTKLPAKRRSKGIMPAHTRRLMTKAGPKKVVVNPEVKKKTPAVKPPRREITRTPPRTVQKPLSSQKPKLRNPAISTTGERKVKLRWQDKEKPSLQEKKEPQGWKTKSVSDFLDPDEASLVTYFINRGEWDRVLKYFKKPEMEAKLKSKGIIPEYLWYSLQAATNNYDERMQPETPKSPFLTDDDEQLKKTIAETEKNLKEDNSVPAMMLKEHIKKLKQLLEENQKHRQELKDIFDRFKK